MPKYGLIDLDIEVLKTALEKHKRYLATQDYKLDEKIWYDIIRRFQRRFPIRQIETLTMDEYVEGRRNRDSFCYWIEVETKSVASMQGARVDKFGVWFNKKHKNMIIWIDMEAVRKGP